MAAWVGGVAMILAGVVVVATLVRTPEANESAGPPTTTPAEVESTTSTTAAVDTSIGLAQEYEAELVLMGSRVQDIVDSVLGINAAWDGREISQELAAEYLTEQVIESERAAEKAVSLDPGRGSPSLKKAVVDALDALAFGVGAVRLGLLEPGSRALRDDATAVVVFDANVALLAIDTAISANALHLRRPAGAATLAGELRVGDCYSDMSDDGVATAVDCLADGAIFVLSVVDLPRRQPADEIACIKSALPYWDVEFFDSSGTWLVTPVESSLGSGRSICGFDPGSLEAPRPIARPPVTGPLVTVQGVALQRIDLGSKATVEVGECLSFAGDDSSVLLDRSLVIRCSSDAEFAVVAMFWVAPDLSNGSDDRFSARIWAECADQIEQLPGEPVYELSDLFAVPGLATAESAISPMVAVACMVDADQFLSRQAQQ